MKRFILAGLLASAGIASGCDDDLPTAVSDDLVPVSANTAEILLPFDAFAGDLRILTGYGTLPQLDRPLLARQFGDTLDARPLVRFGDFPVAAQVEDTTGTTHTDSTLTFVGGRVVARFDTTEVPDAPVDLRASALTVRWHPASATWEHAVDTAGERTAWPEPGAGPVEPVDVSTWDPAEEDSVVFEVDSATMARWSDTTTLARGLRLEAEDPGVRLRLRSTSLRIEARPSVNPDTTIEMSAGRRETTFVFAPAPGTPEGLRVGGAPATRSVFRISLPETLEGPPELCEALGCPVRLSADRVNFAALVLTTRRTPAAFRSSDSLRLDVRPVLRPELLPKSPLGGSLMPLGSPTGRPHPGTLRPELFADAAGETVEIPITGHVRDLLRASADPDRDVSNTLALLAPFEPLTFSFAEFVGPGAAGEPVLRIVVTQAEGVGLQ